MKRFVQKKTVSISNLLRNFIHQLIDQISITLKSTLKKCKPRDTLFLKVMQVTCNATTENLGLS